MDRRLVGACVIAIAGCIVTASGCSGTEAASFAPPLLPTPRPGPTPLPSPPLALNTIYLTAPTVPPQSPASPFVGRYQLDIVADAPFGNSCVSMPDYAMRRTFTADIHAVSDYFAVKLYDARFLADGERVGYGCGDPRLPQTGAAICHQFILAGTPDKVMLTLSALDDWRGSEIWESLPDGFLLQTIGSAEGSMRNGRIDAAGPGSLWHGNGLPASKVSSCRSDAVRFTFTPK